MNTPRHHRSTLATLACLAALGLGACKDDSPCDEGQEVRNVNCYPLSTGGGAGQPGAGGDGADAGDGGAAFGRACTDTAASSDCGGDAPICAPLPAGSVCTQILCQAGEPNADVCPSGWTCLASSGNPSVCVNF